MSENDREARSDTVDIGDYVVSSDDSFLSSPLITKIISKDDHRVTIGVFGDVPHQLGYESIVVLKKDGTYRIGRDITSLFDLDL